MALMKKTGSITEVVAWPLLLPGTLACRALRLGRHSDLVRMLVNTLVWTALGILVVIFAT
jgi:hypothetical protein